MLKKGFLILLALSILFVPATALAAKGDISFTSIAETETEMYDADGKKILVRSPAEILRPGEVAIYTNRFTNNGEKTADNLVIKNPIPPTAEYLQGSATEEGFDVTFSVNGGKTYDKPDNLTVLDKNGVERPASAKDYTDVRWTRKESLAPGQTGQVEFRIMIK